MPSRPACLVRDTMVRERAEWGDTTRMRYLHGPLAVAAALLTLAGCGGGDADNVAAVSTPSAAPSRTTAATSAPRPTRSVVATPSPTPAWTPCDPNRSSYNGGCETDYYIDSCDASHYSNEVGSLLDAYIENKALVKPERLKDCPQFLPTWNRALTGFDDGSYEVGVDIQPGTYETTAHLTGGQVRDCYWERSTTSGRTIANDFVTAAKTVRVSIRAGEMFPSRGCRNWVRV